MNEFGCGDQKFAVIHADPPWRFVTWSAKNQTRAAANHYAVMSLSDIKELPVATIAARDCVLFLWGINPMLPQALTVIDAWGFTYKAVAFTWGKRTKRNRGWNMGLGKWTRQNTETCFLATRGKPRRRAADVREFIEGPIREHSRKPDEVYSRIERLVEGPYIDLFARCRRPNWTCWGNEIDRFAPAAAVAA